MSQLRKKIHLFLILCFALSAAARGQVSKVELPNDFSIELLGRCLLYSFSYQRMLNQNLGIELGVAGLGGSGGGVIFFSGGARAYFSEKNASPCIAGGIVFLTDPTSKGPFSGSESVSWGYLGPGFEYRSAGGFLLRGTLYFLVRDGFFVWPGVHLGIAF
jgi:hypothetical protein